MANATRRTTRKATAARSTTRKVASVASIAGVTEADMEYQDGAITVSEAPAWLSQALARTHENGEHVTVTLAGAEAAELFERTVRQAAKALSIGANVRKTELANGSVTVKFAGANLRKRASNKK